MFWIHDAVVFVLVMTSASEQTRRGIRGRVKIREEPQRMCCMRIGVIELVRERERPFSRHTAVGVDGSGVGCEGAGVSRHPMQGRKLRQACVRSAAQRAGNGAKALAGVAGYAQEAITCCTSLTAENLAGCT